MKFEAGNETRERIWSDFVAEQNEEWSEKRVVFCSYRCFLESEKLSCEENSVSERNFLFTRGILKHFFYSFLVKRIGYDFLLTLGWFLQWFEAFWKSIWILCKFHGFSCILMIFGLIFAFFWRFFCFTGSNGSWKKPLYLSIFIININYSFLGRNLFLLRNMTKKWRQLERSFLIFCSFSFFFLFSAKLLCLLWLAYCFVSIWIPYWLKGIFLWIYMFLK